MFLLLSHSRLLCTLLICEYPVVFLVAAGISLFSEYNHHCEVAEIVALQKSPVGSLTDFLRAGARKQVILW